jgi:hypothetical protein
MPQPTEVFPAGMESASEPWMLGLKKAVPVASVMIAMNSAQ